jgi:hypothetical protein
LNQQARDDVSGFSLADDEQQTPSRLSPLIAKGETLEACEGKA